ncbi:MAG: helix-turn-helix domain-containing protein [Planctomycetota bacterium]
MTVELIISNLSERECIRLFQAFRSPDSMKCIKCGRPQSKIYSDRRDGIYRYHCAQCKVSWNDFTGTAFENSRIPVSQWFKAIYYFLELHLTARESAQRLNINRNTAQLLNKKIQANKLWCRLLLNKIIGSVNSNVEYLMTLQEVQDYLVVSRQTIYRLISRGGLPSIKVGGQWRFRPEEIQKYLNSKLSRYGTSAIGEFYYFREDVLNKYRKDKTKYYLQEEAYQGWVGNKQDYHDVQTLGKNNLADGDKVFVNLHYRRVVMTVGQPALAIRHKDYSALPPEEYVHWSGFLIAERRH